MTMKRKARAKILTVIIILTLTSQKMSRLACSPILVNTIGTNDENAETMKKGGPVHRCRKEQQQR